LDKQGLD